MDGQKGCNVHSSVCQFFTEVYILGNTQETNVLVMKVKICHFTGTVISCLGMINPISCKCDLLWENKHYRFRWTVFF